VYWSNKAASSLSNLDSNQTLAAQLFPAAFSMPNAPIWQDSSTTEDCKRLEEIFGGAQALADCTGSRAYERFTGNQIARVSPALGLLKYLVAAHLLQDIPLISGCLQLDFAYILSFIIFTFSIPWRHCSHRNFRCKWYESHGCTDLQMGRHAFKHMWWNNFAIQTRA
jgi:hypothetical protein